MLTISKDSIDFVNNRYTITTTNGYYSIFYAEDISFTTKEELLHLAEESKRMYDNFDYLTNVISAWSNDEIDDRTDQFNLLKLLKRDDEKDNYEYYHSELNDMVVKEKKKIEKYTTVDISVLVDAVKKCPEDSLLFFYLNSVIYLALADLIC
jgi:hypothetical protein